MPLPTRKKTYRSKKNESGIIDHKDILLYTNNKSTLFDAYSMQNIKKFKRNNSYMAGPSDLTVSKKVPKKKTGKRLLQAILLQTIQTHNIDSLSTPKKVTPSQGENGDTFDNFKALQTPVVLTPDLSLHVKRLSADPFDKLCNSRLEQTNKLEIQHLDPRVNLSSDEEYLPLNTKDRTNIANGKKDLNADNFHHIHRSDDDDENRALTESPLLPARRRSKLRKRKVLNKFPARAENTTSESLLSFYNHQLKVENVTDKKNDTSLSLTQVLKDVGMTKSTKTYSTRNCNKSRLQLSPHGASNSLFSSTPRATSHKSMFRGSIGNFSPVLIGNGKNEIIPESETVTEIDHAEASPPSVDKIGSDITVKTKYVLDKEYNGTPVLRLSPECVSDASRSSRSKSHSIATAGGTENIKATIDCNGKIDATKINSGNLVVSQNLFESFSRSVSISCVEQFQWKSKEDINYIDSVNGDIAVPPDSVKVLDEHSAIELLSSCYETYSDIEHSSSELKLAIFDVDKFQVDDQKLRNDEIGSQPPSLSEDNSHVNETQEQKSLQCENIKNSNSETHSHMEDHPGSFQQPVDNSLSQNIHTKSLHPGHALSDNNLDTMELGRSELSQVKKLRTDSMNNEDNLVFEKKLCVHIDKLNESVMKRYMKPQKLSIDTKENCVSSDHSCYSIESDQTKSLRNNSLTQSEHSENESYRTIETEDKSICALSEHSLNNSYSIQSEQLKYSDSECIDLENKTIESYKSIKDRFACKEPFVNVKRLNASILQKYNKCQEVNNETRENSDILSSSLLPQSSGVKLREFNKLNGHVLQKYTEFEGSYSMSDTSSVQNGNSNISTRSADKTNSPNFTQMTRIKKGFLLSPKVLISRLKSIDILNYVKPNDKRLSNKMRKSHIEDSKSLKITDELITNVYKNGTPEYSNMSPQKIQGDCDVNTQSFRSFKNNTVDSNSVGNQCDESNHEDTGFNINDKEARFHCDKIQNFENNISKPDTSNVSLLSLDSSNSLSNKNDTKKLLYISGNSCDNESSTKMGISDTSNDSINKRIKNIKKCVKSPKITARLTRSKATWEKSSKNNYSVNLLNDESLLVDSTDKFLEYDTVHPIRRARTKVINNEAVNSRASINLRTRRVVCQNSFKKATAKRKRMNKLDNIGESEVLEMTNVGRRMSVWEKNFDYAIDDEIERISDMHLFKVPNLLGAPKQKEFVDESNSCLRDGTCIVLLPGKKWKKSLSIVRRMTIMGEAATSHETSLRAIKTSLEGDDFRESLTNALDIQSPLKGRKYRESVAMVMNLQSPIKCKKYRQNVAAKQELDTSLKGRKYRESVEMVRDLQYPFKATQNRENVESIMELQSPLNRSKCRDSGTSEINLQTPLNARKDMESAASVMNLQSPQQNRIYRKSAENNVYRQVTPECRKSRQSFANLMDIQSPANLREKIENDRESLKCRASVMDFQSPGKRRMRRHTRASIMNLQSPREEMKSGTSVANVMDSQFPSNRRTDGYSVASAMVLDSSREEMKCRDGKVTAVDIESQGFLSETCNDTAINFSSLSISDDEASGVIEKSIDTSHCDRITTPRDVVLQRCNQTNAVPFNQCYTDVDLKNCRKIGEGVYGEVFLYRSHDGGVRVMKVIPVAGDIKVNGEPQKTFEEILSEIVIAMELSALRTPLFDDCKDNSNAGADVERIDLSSSVENATDTFNKVLGVHCVIGSYPSRLLDLWELYDETRGSENDSPALLPEEQQYIVLELANAGQDLESYQFNNAEQALALFYQVAYALAVAEECCQFEHRDLHWGNVLIAPTEDKTVRFVLRGSERRVSSCGVRATIIDYSLSRLGLGEEHALYTDLARDPTLFDAVGDYQFDIYRLMKERNGNLWKDFEPYTNILWLHYTLDKMITALRYKRTNTKLHKHYIAKLKELKGQILNYHSCVEFVLEDATH